MTRPALALPALLFLAPALLAGACILDLDGLAGGPPGTTSSGSGGAGTGGGGTGGMLDGAPPDSPPVPCGVLDCAACASSCQACPPLALAAGADVNAPWALATMDNSVYWTNKAGNTVSRRTTSGATPEMLTTSIAPQAIAAALGYVVWTAQDGLWGCPSSACDAGKKKILDSTAPGSMEGVAFDGQTVFVTDRGDGQNGRVLACAPADCASPIEIAKGQSSPSAIALTSTSVLWADVGNGNANGNLFRATKTGKDMTQIASALTSPTAVAADDTYVYFTQWSAAGRIFRCPHGSGYCDAPEPITKAGVDLSFPLDLAIGGGRITWTESGGGTIASCPLPGCGSATPRVHASARIGLRRVAIGPSCLLWVDDTDGGGVFQLPR
ncbi:MAG: hypothetical protein U0359_32380 [Byssovorax sp.]